MIFFIPLPRLSISPNLLKKSANKGFLLLDGTVSGFNCWNRIQFTLYLFADSLRITFCFSESDDMVIITDTKYQRAAFAISKS